MLNNVNPGVVLKKTRECINFAATYVFFIVVKFLERRYRVLLFPLLLMSHILLSQWA